MTPLSLAHVKTKEDMNIIVFFVDYMEMTAPFNFLRIVVFQMNTKMT